VLKQIRKRLSRFRDKLREYWKVHYRIELALVALVVVYIVIDQQIVPDFLASQKNK